MTILCASIVPWNMRNIQLCEIKAAGTKAMNNTLDNAAAVDAGSGQVTIPLTAHGFSALSHIGIRGSTNYNDSFELVSVATNTFNIYATYVAETFAGTETVRPELHPEKFFRLLEARLHLSDTGKSTGDTFSMILDSGQPAGAYHDITIDSQDMNGLTQDIGDFSNLLKFFNDNDMLYFTFANGNSRNWGLEVKYAVLGG